MSILIFNGKPEKKNKKKKYFIMLSAFCYSSEGKKFNMPSLAPFFIISADFTIMSNQHIVIVVIIIIVFTVNIGTPKLLTVLVLEFKNVHFNMFICFNNAG